MQIIRFEMFIDQINQENKLKLEELVLERFLILKYINFDSLKLSLETFFKKEVTCEELVQNFLEDEEIQKNVYETLKKGFENVSKKAEKDNSVFNLNLHNVFWNNNGKMIMRDVSINETVISKEIENNIKNHFDFMFIKLQEDFNKWQNSVEKAFKLQSENFSVKENGVQVTVKVENFKKMLSYFIKILLPFITDKKIIDELNKHEFLNTDDDPMTFDGNVKRPKNKTFNTDDGFQNELSNKVSPSISTFNIPISCPDIVLHWAMMFAYGNLKKMRKIPLRHFQSISIHAESIIENYSKQDNLMKNAFNNLTIDVAKLIIKQINELTDEVKEEDQLTRFITIEYINENYK